VTEMGDSVRMKDVAGDQSDGRGAGIDNLLYSGAGQGRGGKGEGGPPPPLPRRRTRSRSYHVSAAF
jgi:hypothetical protein